MGDNGEPENKPEIPPLAAASRRLHLLNGRWPKGVTGNPGGRPKGLALRIREETKDGDEIVRFMLRVFRGQYKGAGAKERMEAATWLSDRGFGKPAQVLTGPNEQPIQVEVVKGAADEFARRVAGLAARAG